MVRPGDTTSADKRIRELRREFASFDKQEAGPERAAQLATFTRAAHADRQLNMAMHTAALCLEDDPDAPKLLVEAYAGSGGDDLEAELSALSDLRDLGRYMDRADITAEADDRQRDVAFRWVADADDGERRYRLRTVQSITSRELADEIRDTSPSGT